MQRDEMDELLKRQNYVGNNPVLVKAPKCVIRKYISTKKWFNPNHTLHVGTLLVLLPLALRSPQPTTVVDIQSCQITGFCWKVSLAFFQQFSCNEPANLPSKISSWPCSQIKRLDGHHQPFDSHNSVFPFRRQILVNGVRM